MFNVWPEVSSRPQVKVHKSQASRDERNEYFGIALERV